MQLPVLLPLLLVLPPSPACRPPPAPRRRRPPSTRHLPAEAAATAAASLPRLQAPASPPPLPTAQPGTRLHLRRPYSHSLVTVVLDPGLVAPDPGAGDPDDPAPTASPGPAGPATSAPASGTSGSLSPPPESRPEALVGQRPQLLLLLPAAPAPALAAPAPPAAAAQAWGPLPPTTHSPTPDRKSVV